MKTRKVLTVILILLICAAGGYFVYECIQKQAVNWNAATKMILISIAALTSIIKMNYTPSARRTLKHYESFYKEELGQAFSDDEKNKKNSDIQTSESKG